MKIPNIIKITGKNILNQFFKGTNYLNFNLKMSINKLKIQVIEFANIKVKSFSIIQYINIATTPNVNILTIKINIT